MNKYFFIFLISFFLFSCGKNHSDVSNDVFNIKSLPIHNSRLPSLLDSSANYKWDDSYSRAIVEELLKEENKVILSLKLSELDLTVLGCSNYNSFDTEDRIVFLIVYLASIAEAESDFKPFAQTGENIGLFQIDLRSAHRHGGEEYINLSDKNLKNGIINSRIAVKILKNQLRDRNNRLLPKYYWQVLYSKGFNNFIKYFRNNINITNCN